MLARNEGYHLVEDGTITEVERAALVELRDRLQRGEIERCSAFKLLSPGLIFAMNAWYEPHACGTVGCIAGLCYEISGGKAFPFVTEAVVAEQFLLDPIIPRPGGTVANYDVHPRLYKLFLPSHQARRSPQEGAHAITTFLATGNAEWQGYGEV